MQTGVTSRTLSGLGVTKSTMHISTSHAIIYTLSVISGEKQAHLEQDAFILRCMSKVAEMHHVCRCLFFFGEDKENVWLLT